MNKYTSFNKLSRSFYTRSNVVQIAQDLLGKYLFAAYDGYLTAGKIVETEAYNGRQDKASHAYMKRTARTQTMYEEGGRAYIYLCYGIHHLFNVVTNRSGMADAVLVRAIEPALGVETMIARRGGDKKLKLTAGPGSLSQAMGIDRDQNGVDLRGDRVWIAENGSPKPMIEIDRRVGVDYAEEDAMLPWRFYVKDNPYVSRKKQPQLILN